MAVQQLTTTDCNICTHKHITDGPEWRVEGDRIRGGVMSRCKTVFLDLNDISEGARESSGQPPPINPSHSVAASQLSPKISTDPSMSGALVIKYIDGATKHHL